MELQLNVPALLFPAISLTMLAYNARYLAIAALIRNLHKEYQSSKSHEVKVQIKILTSRLKLVRTIQELAIVSFICAIVTMFLIYLEYTKSAKVVFVISLLSMLASLVYLLFEIHFSMKALKIRLKDMEE